MDLNQFTQKAREGFMEAQAEARRRHHQQIDVWHLLFSLLNQHDGIVPAILEKLNVTPGAVTLAVGRELDRLPAVTGSVDATNIYITQALQDAINKAEAAAKRLKDEYISVEHLFLGLLESSDSGLKKLFNSFLDRRNSCCSSN